MDDDPGHGETADPQTADVAAQVAALAPEGQLAVVAWWLEHGPGEQRLEALAFACAMLADMFADIEPEASVALLGVTGRLIALADEMP